MWSGKRPTGYVYLAALGLAISACAPSAAPREAGGSSRQPQATAAPKILTFAVPRELDTWNTDITLVTRGGGTSSIQYVGHSKLTVQNDDALSYVPQLATEMPSIDNGTWRVNPNGSMDVEWRIWPNAKWHDGMPMTSDDLLFTFEVIHDPEIPNVIGQPLRLMESAAAPDPRTFVVHWNRPYIDVPQASGLTVMPRHILEQSFRQDKAGFPNHPWMSREFVGLGPYRMVRWEAGAFMEFTRFDDYYKGRPAFDSVIVQFIKDENAIIAAVLSGAVDVVPPVGLDVETVFEVKERFEASGNHVAGTLTGGFFIVEMQHRPEFARPRLGLTNRDVRQALYQAINRPQITEVMSQGLGFVADSWFFPGHPDRASVEAAIPQYPYDLSRSAQLLAGAGWIRGSDGVLVNQETGERFDVQVSPTRDYARMGQIISDFWRRAGAQVEERAVAADRAQDLEQIAAAPGAWFTNPRYYQMAQDRYHTRSIPTTATRWTGRNRGGYANPRGDDIMDRLVATIPTAERLPFHRQLIQEMLGDIAFMPLFWEYDPYLFAKGMKGINGGLWNVDTWDRE
ncbi:MAG: hypothetical protein HW416_3617 [Chloroflexi bacterium]|nr:hypothetical protein [Chloroflexota bacterium]